MSASINEALIRDVVSEVLNRLKGPAGSSNGAASGPRSSGGVDGVFQNVDEAVAAARRGFEQLSRTSLEKRAQAIQCIRDICIQQADELGRIELEETQIGRLDHKIEKLHVAGRTIGLEFLTTEAVSGDYGLTVTEHAPWGVLGVITPVTHSVPTLASNAVMMIAAGNTLVVNPHPGGARCAAIATQRFNRAIREKTGLENLICLIEKPTLETADQIFRHRDVAMLVVTGGPGVVNAAMSVNKKAIVAGPGNPPVVVDETADIEKAAAGIIKGAAYDNNLLCIGEKEVFVVASVFNKMMDAMKRAGAVQLNAKQVQQLTDVAFTYEKDHYAVRKELVGRDCTVLAEAAGFKVPADTQLLFGETDENNPFVPEEQMMPFVPFVRVPNFDEALALALRHEHGFGHTAIIHSNNLANITRMGQAMNTTIFVVNGPCTAGLGVGGEGYPSYSIATPTGEGITNPLTFTRFRRIGVSGALRCV